MLLLSTEYSGCLRYQLDGDRFPLLRSIYMQSISLFPLESKQKKESIGRRRSKDEEAKRSLLSLSSFSLLFLRLSLLLLLCLLFLSRSSPLSLALWLSGSLWLVAGGYLGHAAALRLLL